jgi:hypothetical protein
MMGKGWVGRRERKVRGKGRGKECEGNGRELIRMRREGTGFRVRGRDGN